MTQKKGKSRKPKKPPTPPQPKPWDVPTPPEKGDTTKEAVFVAIGGALSAWENLESWLSHIFAELVAPNAFPLAARRAYGSILTFRGRKEMIQAAAKAVFFVSPNDTLQERLKSFLDEAQNFAARRNEIAHGIVTEYWPKRSLIRFATKGFVLGPPAYATNKTDLEPGRVILEPVYHAPSYAYSSAEIEGFERHFERIEREARSLYLHLMKHQIETQQP